MKTRARLASPLSFPASPLPARLPLLAYSGHSLLLRTRRHFTPQRCATSCCHISPVCLRGGCCATTSVGDLAATGEQAAGRRKRPRVFRLAPVSFFLFFFAAHGAAVRLALHSLLRVRSGTVRGEDQRKRQRISPQRAPVLANISMKTYVALSQHKRKIIIICFASRSLAPASSIWRRHQQTWHNMAAPLARTPRARWQNRNGIDNWQLTKK